MSKSRSPYEKQAASVSQQQQTAGQSNINTGTGMAETAINNPTSSPMYKALYATQAGQLSNAYQNAASNQKAKAAQAGFGAEQPVTQGNDLALSSQEAQAQGALPGQVMQETVPLELQAGKDITGAGTSELSAGNNMFTAGVVPLEEQYQNLSAGGPLGGVLGGALRGGIKGFLPGGNGALEGALAGI